MFEVANRIEFLRALRAGVDTARRGALRARAADPSLVFKTVTFRRHSRHGGDEETYRYVLTFLQMQNEVNGESICNLIYIDDAGKLASLVRTAVSHIRVTTDTTL